MKQHSSAGICVDLNSQAVDVALRLPQSDKAGTEKQAEDLAQAESFHPVVVKLAGFVVDGRHQILAGVGERLSEFEHPRNAAGTGRTCIREILRA